MSEDEIMEVEHQQNKNEEKAQQSDDFSDYEDYKKYKSQKPKDDVNDHLNRFTYEDNFQIMFLKSIGYISYILDNFF